MRSETDREKEEELMQDRAASGERHRQYTTTGEKRRHVRIAYPPAESPKVIISGRECFLADISVKAIKFHQRPYDRLHLSRGDFIRAQIIFHDGESLSVEGSILRIDKNDVVLQLSSGIHSARIFKERKWLLENRTCVR